MSRASWWQENFGFVPLSAAGVEQCKWDFSNGDPMTRSKDRAEAHGLGIVIDFPQGVCRIKSHEGTDSE